MYTVNDIAEACGVSSETVRRWLRDGALIGTCENKRVGYRIKEEDFEQFLLDAPRYIALQKADIEAPIRRNMLHELWDIRNRIDQIVSILEGLES